MSYKCHKCLLKCSIETEIPPNNKPVKCAFFPYKEAKWIFTDTKETKCETCEFYEPDIKKCPNSVNKWCLANNFKSYVKRGTLHHG